MEADFDDRGECDRGALLRIEGTSHSHLRRGRTHEFAERFGIEVRVVPGFENRYDAMRAVQARQRR
jgi:hypothetical protein